MSVTTIPERSGMKAALLAMTKAVYEGNDDERKAALFDLLTAWGFLNDDLAQDEPDDERAERRARSEQRRIRSPVAQRVRVATAKVLVYRLTSCAPR